MEKFRITMDNPDGSLETVWEKKATRKVMVEEFDKICQAQRKAREANPEIKWRVVRVFDAWGEELWHES